MKPKHRPLWPLLVVLLAAAALFLFYVRACSNTIRNGKAAVDVSRLSSGAVTVRYTGRSAGRVKVRITRGEGTDYHYDLPADGKAHPFTLTEGSGSYTLTVLEQVEGERYTPVFTCQLAFRLSDPTAPYPPFLEPNPYVPFTSDSQSTLLAAQLAEGLKHSREKIGLLFDYVVDHISYDWDQASSVSPGYLPDPDRTLDRGTGICLDYASLLCAMLRSQGIPCRLLVGYAGEDYHAWVEVPGREGGWERLDPALVSANQRSEAILAYVRDDSHYRTRYRY